ncbi:CidA/LrgA family protein [Allopusillimonas ginsengisoli]|uniref:CidA/LrgA family protein n=1 Tax=Allopusillimonas ginsengisoli TaxID=453575 RepID=UPI0039C1423A
MLHIYNLVTACFQLVNQWACASVSRFPSSREYFVLSVLFGAALLVAMQFLGDAVVRLMGVPLPGPLLGMVFMLPVLMLLRRVPEGLSIICRYLLGHMPLLFVPLIAGVMTQFGVLGLEWIPFLLSCIVGTAITIVVTALVFRWMMQRTSGKKS